MDKQVHNTENAGKLRVLIVENRLKTRKTHTDNVGRWGYDPVVAEGSGDALIQDALELSRARCCHLALVDKRLRDDYTHLDTSGIDLIKKLLPTSTILITGYQDHESTLAAMQQGAVTVVAKKDGPEVVRRELDRAAGMWNPRLEVVWLKDWSAEQVRKTLLDTSTIDRRLSTDEITFLLTRLFPSSTQIVFSRLSGGTEPSNSVSAAVRHGSVVLVANVDQKVPVILKFVSREKMKQEHENYVNYVEGYVGGSRHAELRNNGASWALGCIVYALVGAKEADLAQSLSTFESFYADLKNEDADVIEVIENFFEVVWKSNYQRPPDDITLRELRSGSLFDLYDQAWKGSLSKSNADLGNNLNQLYEKYRLDLPGFSDLYSWVSEHRSDSHFPRAKFGVVHGDLHGGNILLDSQKLPWVIDFEDTGFGHRIRDFAELAQNTLTRLCPLGVDESEFYEIAIWMTRLPTQREYLTEGIAKNKHARRAYKAVDKIVSLARTIADTTDEEFLWSVLLDIRKMLNVVQHHKDRFEKLCKLGGIIATRLSRGTRLSWPPESWPRVIWISRDTLFMIKILFLAANPSDTTRLQIDREYRGIRETIQKADQREQFTLAIELAVRVSELIDLLVKQKPTIVHFSGHGSGDGEIILEDESGNKFPLPQEAVKNIFGVLNRNSNQIRCVILNACFTEQQAKYIAEYVDIVVGISSEIGDTSAIKFASAFYASIGERQNVQTAFDLACVNIDLHRLGFEDTLRLITKQGIDPNNYYLV